MKVGIIGAGRVGAASALALVARGSAREVVVVDRTGSSVAMEPSYFPKAEPK
jgi:malate/lactate dehydrogenase